MTDETDLKIAALLGLPDREPDERFALRVTQAVLANQRLQAARRRAWRKFVHDLAGCGAVVLAFLLLGRLHPEDLEGDRIPLFSPAMIAVLLLGLWTAVAPKPGASKHR